MKPPLQPLVLTYIREIGLNLKKTRLISIQELVQRAFQPKLPSMSPLVDSNLFRLLMFCFVFAIGAEAAPSNLSTTKNIPLPGKPSDSQGSPGRDFTIVALPDTQYYNAQS